MSFVSMAHADVIYTFDQGVCCGTGPFATLVLHSIDANTVQVTETLTTGNVFAFSAGEPLDFNLDKAFSIVAGTLSAGFSLGGADTPNPFPSFSSSIVCTSPCIYGNGTSPPTFSGPLTFEVQNLGGLSPSDFIASVDKTGSYFFTTDVGAPKVGGGFNTGNVAALAGTVQAGPPVPEPSSMFLYATGLLALMWSRKYVSRKLLRA
jgi:hypothetical protein